MSNRSLASKRGRRGGADPLLLPMPSLELDGSDIDEVVEDETLPSVSLERMVRFEKKVNFLSRVMKSLYEKSQAIEDKNLDLEEQTISLLGDLSKKNDRIQSLEIELLRLKSSKESRFAHDSCAYERKLDPGFFEDHDSQVNTREDSSTEENDKELDEEGIETEFHEVSLAEDTFSFLISAQPMSTPFVTGMVVFCLKNIIFSMIMFNLLDRQAPFNKLGVPVAVETPVMTSQLLAFIISVFTQSDLITSLILIHQGYNPVIREVYGSDANKGGTLPQWIFSILCALFDGLFGLGVTFFLIVTSGTVIDVLLNFAAVEFVASLDESTFYLAQTGFLGGSNKAEAAVVSESTYRIKQGSTTHFFARIKATTLVGIFCIVLLMWVIVLVRQAHGYYSPDWLIVQFDDSIQVQLAPHSGFYRFERNYNFLNVEDRFRYKEHRTGGGQFGYCIKRREWRFFLQEDDLEPKDPCDDRNVLLRSVKTQELDISKLSEPDDWFVKYELTNHFSRMERFFLDAACLEEADCGGLELGRCEKFKCQCAEGRYGFRCEYEVKETCKVVSLDNRFQKEFVADRTISTQFQVLKNSTNQITFCYGRPVYWRYSDGGKEKTDLLLYTGVRWAITSVEEVLNLKVLGDDVEETTLRNEVAEILSNETFFAGDIARIYVLSEPVVYRSADDKFGSPVNLDWAIVPDAANFTEVDILASDGRIVFLCNICDDDRSICKFGNKCVNGTCVCSNGATGILCEQRPTGDGKCDGYFNVPEFQFDGGDCCESTCTDTEMNQCGFVSVGGIRGAYVGFPNCTDPSVVGRCSEDGMEPCLIPYRRYGLDLTNSFELRPVISENGHLLVLTDVVEGVVRVLEFVGSSWVQRGRELLGDEDAIFGEIVDIATTSREVISESVGRTPAILAISQTNGRERRVQIFVWGRGASDWTEPYEIKGLYPLLTISIGYDFDRRSPDRAHLLSILIIDTRGMHLYECSGLEQKCRQRRQDFIGIAAGLSSNGDVAAVLQNDSFKIINLRTSEEDSVQVSDLSHSSEILSIGVQTHPIINATSSLKGIGVVTNSDTTLRQYLLKDGRLIRRDLPLEPFPAHEIDRAVFSRNGNGLVVQGTQPEGQTQFHAFVWDEHMERWLPLKVSEVDKNMVLEAKAASISNSGKKLAVVSKGTKVQLLGLRHPTLCNDTDTLIHVSSTVCEDGREFMWGLFEYQSAGEDIRIVDVIRNCKGCYNRSFYSGNVVTEEACVPSSSSCSMLFASGDVRQFVAHTIDDGGKKLTNITSFEAKEGQTNFSDVKLFGHNCHRRSICQPPKQLVHVFHSVHPIQTWKVHFQTSSFMTQTVNVSRLGITTVGCFDLSRVCYKVSTIKPEWSRDDHMVVLADLKPLVSLLDGDCFDCSTTIGACNK